MPGLSEFTLSPKLLDETTRAALQFGAGGEIASSVVAVTVKTLLSDMYR